MRQTDSAMRMLISAYKAVLANCYIKETLAGGVKRFYKGVALSSFLTAVLAGVSTPSFAAQESTIFFNKDYNEIYNEDLEITTGISGKQGTAQTDYNTSLTVNGILTINKSGKISGAVSDAAIIVSGGLKANYVGKITAYDIYLNNVNNSSAYGIAMQNGITTGDHLHHASLSINSKKGLSVSGFSTGMYIDANNSLSMDISGSFNLNANSISDNFRGIYLGGLINASDQRDLLNYTLTTNDDINITNYKTGFWTNAGGNLSSHVTSKSGNINIINNREQGESGILIQRLSKFNSEVNFSAKKDFVIENYEYGIRNEYKDLNINLDGLVKISDVNTGIYTTYSGTNVNIKSLAEDKVVNSLYVKATQYGLNANNGSNIDISSADNQIISESYGIKNSGSSTSVSLSGQNTNFVFGADYSSHTSGVLLTRGAKTSITSQQAYNVLGVFEESTDSFKYSKTAVVAKSYGQTEISALSGNSLYASDLGINTESSGKVTLESAEGSNFIQANDIDKEDFQENFGNGYAIKALGKSTVTLNAVDGNTLLGAVFSRDKGTSIILSGVNDSSSKHNIISSYTEIENAGNIQHIDKYKDKRVISALYAEGEGANIVLNGELNSVQTYADSSDYEHTLERTVWAYDGADITINGGVNISTDRYDDTKDRNNSDDIAIVAGTAADLKEDDIFTTNNTQVLVNYKGSSNLIEGDLISAYDGNLVIRPLKESEIQTYSATSRANTPNFIKIKGNAIAGNGGKLSIDLGDGGSWIGRADDYQDASVTTGDFSEQHVHFFNPAFSSNIVHNGEVNLTMGEGSLWDVTGQSWITKIDGNGGEINLIDSDNKESASHALHVGKLSGSHTFVMNLDTEHSVSDMLYVKEADANGATQSIDIRNINGYETLQDGDKLRFATVNPDEAKLNFKVFFQGQELDFAEPVVSAAAKQRAVAYAMYRDNGIKDQAFKVAYEDFNPEDGENDGYNGESFDTNKPGTDYVAENYGTKNWYLERQSAGDQTSDAGKTVVDLSRANYANAVYMDTLNKRQGEARFVGDTDHGVWVRLRHDNIGKEDAFRSHNTMVEVGIDQRDVHDYGEFHTGVALDYMNGSLDYHTVDGDGDIERYGIWFYTTYLGNDGQYADLILKYGHLKNDFGFNTKTQGEHVTGDYTNETASISAEYGWKFSNSHNYYIEPQAQLQYTYITGADYTTSQGSRVDLDSIHSLIGRVGFRAGKDFLDWEHPASFYLRADALHEFLGDQDIRAYDNTGVMDVTYENDDTWYTVGLGMTVKSSDNTYFFIEGETALGADNEDTYTVSGGFRHSF